VQSVSFVCWRLGATVSAMDIWARLLFGTVVITHKVRTGSLGVNNRPSVLPLNPDFKPRGPEIHTDTNKPIIASNVCESPKYRTIQYSFIINVLYEIGSRNTTVTSDFRPDVEIWPFRACAIKTCTIVDSAVGQIISRSTERIIEKNTKCKNVLYS